MLAFWTTRHAVQMDRLFRRSLLMRPKWDDRRGNSTYGADLIAKAIASPPPRAPSGPETSLTAAIARLNRRFAIISVGNKVAVMENLSDGSIKTLWPFHEFKKLLSKESVTILSTTPTGRPTQKTVPLASLWITHPEGRQYEQLVYQMPGGGVRCGPGRLQRLLRHHRATDGGRLVEEQRSCPHGIICNGDNTLYDWLFNWMAALGAVARSPCHVVSRAARWAGHWQGPLRAPHAGGAVLSAAISSHHRRRHADRSFQRAFEWKNARLCGRV